jgi:hypothetical protein
MPVLDGLDEVAAEHRAESVDQINRFWESHQGGPLVLCSRLAEYEQLPERLNLGGAVTLVQPSVAEIDRYLSAAGPQWNGIRAHLADPRNVDLPGLLATPLMLNIAVLAYQGGDPTELRGTSAHGEGQDRLWSRYVSTMMRRAYDPVAIGGESSAPYRESQVMRWLAWLAHEMQAGNAAELWIHECAGPAGLRVAVKASIAVVVALFTLIAGLIGGSRSLYALEFGLSLGAVVGLSSTPKPRYRRVLDARRLLVAGLGPAAPDRGSGDPAVRERRQSTQSCRYAACQWGCVPRGGAPGGS